MNPITVKNLIDDLKITIPPQIPENNIADYIDAELKEMIDDNEYFDVIRFLLVGFANEQPIETRNILIKIHNSFRAWYLSKLNEDDEFVEIMSEGMEPDDYFECFDEIEE